LAKRNFVEDIDNFFFEKFKYEKDEIRRSISDKNMITTFIRRLEQHYLANLDKDDIDESIFVREQAVLTPMKFTPFNNQANANYRYKNMSPCVDMAYNSQTQSYLN